MIFKKNVISTSKDMIKINNIYSKISFLFLQYMWKVYSVFACVILSEYVLPLLKSPRSNLYVHIDVYHYWIEQELVDSAGGSTAGTSSGCCSCEKTVWVGEWAGE